MGERWSNRLDHPRCCGQEMSHVKQVTAETDDLRIVSEVFACSNCGSRTANPVQWLPRRIRASQLSVPVREVRHRNGRA